MRLVPDFISQAVFNLRNGNHYNIIGTEVCWAEDAVNPPTKLEIEAEIARLHYVYNTT